MNGRGSGGSPTSAVAAATAAASSSAPDAGRQITDRPSRLTAGPRPMRAGGNVAHATASRAAPAVVDSRPSRRTAA